MEKKNDSTILLLLAAGLGVYWLTRKKTPTAMPVEDKKSIQPVVEQPITVTPIYEQPIYVAPIMDQPVQDVEFTPVSDMFNTVWQPNYDNKTPMEPVFNMNIEPVE
jgi:hypothetical protein